MQDRAIGEVPAIGRRDVGVVDAIEDPFLCMRKNARRRQSE
jgi:hypothetical protein